jgi:hypothetical protein
MEICVDGKVIMLNITDGWQFTVQRRREIKGEYIEKGQEEELIAFARGIQEGGTWPIPFWKQVQATKISFQVDQIIGVG